MRTSKFLISTLKEIPADTEVISHQLMLRAGMIRKLASGLYTWLPLGLRTLQKVTTVIREEMNNSDALEVLMPAVQPAELWEESGRWNEYGSELLRINDRHDRAFCIGPTHEEVITDLARRELNSYKQLPINFYQIQMKFRDEIRPRYGIMRAREFIMKDAYSFHINESSLQSTYELMYETYTKIFTRLGLEFRAVIADTGSIGGKTSHEFHVLAESGEDEIAFSNESDYAANVEMAEAIPPVSGDNSPSEQLILVDTPNTHSIDEVTDFFKAEKSKIIKTLIVKGSQEKVPLIGLVLRGDHNLNAIKAAKLPEVASPLEFASDEEIEKIIGCSTGSLGPIDINIPFIVDNSAAMMTDFICGANKKSKHYKGANWQRDCKLKKTADIRDVINGDPSPDGKGTLQIKHGIEVGHIFQLGEKYSKAMNATVLNENGKTQTMTMGCYGIGVTRVVAAAIEQNHDDNGIIWPDAIAPFQVVIIPINQHKSEQVKSISEKLYLDLSKAGIDVLLDDREGRPGVKFAEMDLVGIPHRIIISDRGINENKVEYKKRKDKQSMEISLEKVVDTLLKSINNS